MERAVPRSADRANELERPEGVRAVPGSSYCRDHREESETGCRANSVTAGQGLSRWYGERLTADGPRGYWEAKDTHDDIDKAIEVKFAQGYPKDNIIFENTDTAVLIQNGDVAQRADMRKPGELHRLIRLFLDYELPAIEEFRRGTITVQGRPASR